MQNFFTDNVNFSIDTVTLTGEEHHHATRSCRVKTGELIGVTDGCGKRVEARIKAIDSSTLTAVIERDVSGFGEPAVEIAVALSIIKPARFELAVEKCTELGARRFIPVISQRCMVKPGRISTERLRRIAREAAKQAGRSWIPKIVEPVNLSGLNAPIHCRLLVAAMNAEGDIGNVFLQVCRAASLTIVIGPEGDLTADEFKFLTQKKDALPFSLGGLTLRSETAAIVATANVAALSKGAEKIV